MYKFDDRFGFFFERERVFSWIKIIIKWVGLGLFCNNNKNFLFSFFSFLSFFFYSCMVLLYYILRYSIKILCIF